MTQPDPTDFSKPTRQSPIAILLILMRLARFLFRQFWPLLLVFILRPKKTTLYGLVWVAVVVALISAVNSVLSYFYSVYYVAGDELILERGWLRRSRLSVTLNRIQSISFQQTFVHRLFNAVSVEIDTAGSKGSEFSLQAIDEKTAHVLRDYLLSQRDEEVQAAEDTTPAEKAPMLLIQLGLSDLLKIGLSQNHFRTAGILTAVGLGFLDDLQEALGKETYNEMEQSLGAYFESVWTLTLVFVTTLLVLSFAGTMALTVVRNYNLRFWQTGQSFKVSAGLFAKREQSATFRKIQLIRWSAHPIQRWVGMFSLRLYQASGFSKVKQGTIQVPGCYWPQVEAVQTVYFPEANQGEWEWHAPTIHYFRRRFLFLGILPAMAGIGLGLLTQNQHMIPLFVLWAPAAYFWQRRYYRTYYIGLHPDGLQVQAGFFSRSITYLKWKRVHAVSIQQTPYQTRHGIADVDLHTASGDVTLHYLEIEKAREVRDYVLFTIECPTSIPPQTT